MTNDERIARLREMHYTDREARFLLLAALHSGVFVMRQYTAYAGITFGAVTDQFVNKAATRRHIKPFPTRNRTLVYQVCKPVFIAIGEPDNRNRRMKQVDLTRLRLMGLDFVLRNQEHRYLATETEKLEYFTPLAGSTVSFPARVYTSNITGGQTTRFFVEKYPIYDRPPGTAITFLDEDSITAFESFLDRYMALLCTIPQPEIIFVTTNSAMIPNAQRAFVTKTSGQDSRIDFTTCEIDFRERADLESRSIADLERDDLLKLRALQRSRLSPYFDTWKSGGSAALQKRMTASVTLPCPPRARFSPYVLPTGYEFL